MPFTITQQDCILTEIEHFELPARRLPVPAKLIFRTPDGEDITLYGLNMTHKELKKLHDEFFEKPRRVTITITLS
jgi:hypothetical protein